MLTPLSSGWVGPALVASYDMHSKTVGLFYAQPTGQNCTLWRSLFCRLIFMGGQAELVREPQRFGRIDLECVMLFFSNIYNFDDGQMVTDNMIGSSLVCFRFFVSVSHSLSLRVCLSLLASVSVCLSLYPFPLFFLFVGWSYFRTDCILHYTSWRLLCRVITMECLTFLEVSHKFHTDTVIALKTSTRK